MDFYGDFIVAVGEDQAPAFLMFLAGCKKLGWAEAAEETVGPLYNDVSEHFGRVLVNDPDPTDVIDYLVLRRENEVEKDALFLQKPSELLSVILPGAALFDLDEASDDSLIELDHQGFAFFVPGSYRSFHQRRMNEGLSVVFQVGHNIWSLKDMRRIWRENIWPLVSEAMPAGDREVWNSALILSLFMPDRLPIFILPELLETNPTTIRMG